MNECVRHSQCQCQCLCQYRCRHRCMYLILKLRLSTNAPIILMQIKYMSCKLHFELGAETFDDVDVLHINGKFVHWNWNWNWNRQCGNPFFNWILLRAPFLTRLKSKFDSQFYRFYAAHAGGNGGLNKKYPWNASIWNSEPFAEYLCNMLGFMEYLFRSSFTLTNNKTFSKHNFLSKSSTSMRVR